MAMKVEMTFGRSLLLLCTENVNMSMSDKNPCSFWICFQTSIPNCLDQASKYNYTNISDFNRCGVILKDKRSFDLPDWLVAH
uniref:Uncharacterized protein n=1 Tax=Salix viminalis TaxID=40686 RepID=A0A6N2LL03_SALVM